MDVLYFQIVDLGTGCEGDVGYGVSHDPRLDSSVLGIGKSAKDAWDDALDQIAFDGLGTSLMHESGIEAGWLGRTASVDAAEIHEGDEEDEAAEQDGEIKYHVLIRFEDPREDEENEE